MITKTCETKHVPHPFELFGVECGKGWYKLIQPVVDYINEYNKNKTKEEQIQILQIKEKWGYLNIYTNFGNEELDKLIDEAEDKSLTVCEDCGSEENVGMRLTGWYTTMCLDCLKKEVKERNYPQRWQRNSDNKLFWVNTDGTLEEINEDEQQ